MRLKLTTIAGWCLIILTFWSCLTLPSSVLALSDNPTQAELEEELQNIEKQIAQFTIELSKTKTQKITLANKIKQLQATQKSLQLQIKATAVKLASLKGQISQTEKNINANLALEKALKIEIAALLRQINQVDNNILVALSSTHGLSGFVSELQQYFDLTMAVDKLRQQNLAVRNNLTKHQVILSDQKDDASNLLKISTIQQQGLLSSLGEQSQLLQETQGKEANYQALLNDKKKRAAEIKNRIYELFNTGKTINFGQAVEIAKWASGLTGVRPAFLLAILTQESNLGKNVGTCNRSGDPESKSWKVIMKPTRDQEPFKQIIEELGLDIDTTPVSCPMRDKNGNQVGWGGAMGPAQFIPSTWMGYRAKVTALTGHATANPWDIRDAFLASAIKLKGDGADGTDDGDWKAAMRYFSGSTNTKYRFYGDNVLKTTNQYLKDIADL